ncbi:MAG TPA: hypothetical protein VHK90_07140 [Thermoanaerobaculia bacterium]|nr:hypothetical protein [Thermoanaerobaculia bacterium]
MTFVPRIDRIFRRCIDDFSLDLRGLTVYTEAATGAYLYTPILAAVAGAEHVFAYTRDSRYGRRDDVARMTSEAAEAWGVAERVRVRFEKTESDVAAADIITNSGFVRPIDAQLVSWMKPTAVVPLMWETWEFREEQLDLTACRAKGVLVLGTHEGNPPLSMYEYGGFFGMKLLFELGLEGHKTRVIILGGAPGLGRAMHAHFTAVGMDVAWFADDDRDARPYAALPRFFAERGARYDAIIVAEHTDKRLLLGENGLLTYARIRDANPACCIGVISGAIDRDGLASSGLTYFPKVLQPWGLMSYQAGDLGPLPVIELYAGGLKVGEAMARARLRGLSVDDARAYALAHAPAMDFVTHETH